MDGPRQLPPLPPLNNMIKTPAELTPKSKCHSVRDSIDYFIHKLKQDSPFVTRTPSSRLTDQQNMTRILQQFQDSISTSHEREKYEQVDILFGMEQRLSEFSETLRGACNGEKNDHITPWFVEWPVCAKYPNCYICSIKFSQIVSVT